ncbi:hypothetical protein RTF36_03940 [Mammaliicoccus sciuri]|uniref:hypothetical protein n=1 Tax=Mammaliicoccus sciuri TaxID=1296 RepID=UPI0020A1E396|nr:hypothetical protein [Mammaliicoccus sciuri]MCP1286294.1 hypothetical protein [Mammaliicoccus sciuri]MDU0266346.1 hypothetical protein [Mammaliicoccus sciuri]
MEKTNAEIINDFNSLAELTKWLIANHEHNIGIIQEEFYGSSSDEEYKEDKDVINALYSKYNELTN